MKFEYISFSADIPEFRTNGIFDYSIASKYPGALWMCECKKNYSDNILFMSSDVALDQSKKKIINPHKILVVQHGLDPDSAELIRLGAHPFLLTMFESPLYAGNYYDNLPFLSKNFDYLLSYLVDGIEAHKIIPMYFPSFSMQANKLHSTQIAMLDRKFACMVVSNKFVLLKFKFHLTSFSEFIWLLAKYIKQKFSSYKFSYRVDLNKIELQTKRVEVIATFSEKKLLDLFGRGWDKLYRLPPHLRNLIKKHVQVKSILPIEDKIATLGAYRFNICIENVSYPGYVTEKIIDAFVAGTVPVYWGAPDIDQVIPADAYVDARKFKSNDELIEYLQSMKEAVWLTMLDAGRRFLFSEAGLNYSYERTAIKVCERLKKIV